MALKLKYTDEHGIVHINMSPKSSPREDDIQDPKFDTINNRFGSYDLFGGKYDEETCDYGKNETKTRNLFGDQAGKESESNLFGGNSETYDLFGNGGDQPSLFRSRYNSIEEELANTPYAFATERSLRSANKLDITIDRTEVSPSKDIENNRFFNRKLSLEYDDLFTRGPVDTPAFTVTQLIHAQDRYFDLSSRQSVRTPVDRHSVSERVVSGHRTPVSEAADAFTVLNCNSDVKNDPSVPVVPTPKRKREKSFAILTEAPSSRPSSPRSLPVDIRQARVSPFRGRGFREETSRHNTPSTSTANSRNNSPPRRRTSSLSRIDNMATATLPAPLPAIILPRPHSPRDFVRENIKEIRELSELNREKHEAEAEIQKREEEEALLKEMELQEKISKSLVGSRTNSRVNSRSNSRTNSRSNSPSKINLRSRSNSPSSKAAKPNLTKPNLNKDVKENKPFINKNDGMAKPVAHRSRVTSRSVSKSQPQSNDGSPKHSKIPKRQSSVSPVRTTRKVYIPRRPVENNLTNQRFISSSTSSIHETIRVGSQIHDKRNMSQSSQNLSISPKHIKGKPPISPGRAGPPPSNKFINAKRLSPIVGTPNKSPVEDLKPGSARTPLKPTTARKPVKTTGTTPNTSRPISRQPSRATSRETSPDKRKIAAKTPVSKPSTVPSKPITRTPSNKSLTKPVSGKVEARKPISRTDSMKSLTRTPSTKNLADKPPLKKIGSKTSLMSKSNTKINEAGKKDAVKQTKSDEKDGKKENSKKETTDSSTDPEKNLSQDNETQYDKITNDKGELIIMTKKSIVSMTTAAITSQPLEIVTTVTNQLPTTLEKAREKGIFERLGSKDSLTGKEEGHKKDENKSDAKIVDEKKKDEKRKPIFTEDHKLKPLQGPFNDPQLEKVRRKIDDILKTPEISRENILTPSAKARVKPKNDEKGKEKEDKKEPEKPAAKEISEPKPKEEKSEMTEQIRTEATKIVESIITPVEEPKPEPPKMEAKVEKKTIEPIITVVNEKKDSARVEKKDSAGVEKVNTTLVKGEAEVEVQSSNVSTPGIEKIMEKETGSDKSQSNGGFPQSTSTTPKPPARTKRDQKDKENSPKTPENEIKDSPENGEKKPNICSRLMGKCKSKCCPCCVKGEDDDEKETEEVEDLTPKEKQGMMSKFSCCKKKKVEEEVEREIERAAGKGATIEFEDETKRKRKFRDVICCGRKRRVGDSGIPAQNVADVTMSPQDLAMSPGVVNEAGCCGRKRQVERRDSILSDRPPPSCCNRMCVWFRGMCRRREPPASRRASMFSKNKSLSPTLPPEDTRKKLDPSLIEHMSLIRAAVPVLPIVLAYFCLICNVVVPGLGSIFSGMFCLCFGIPRFGPHDGAKYRIGSFVVNLLVGVLQLFTVLFCLVGWGWSIWWGVIMLKLSRKYRKLRAEARAAEAEAPPVTTNNHTRP